MSKEAFDRAVYSINHQCFKYSCYRQANNHFVTRKGVVYHCCEFHDEYRKMLFGKGGDIQITEEMSSDRSSVDSLLELVFIED